MTGNYQILLLYCSVPVKILVTTWWCHQMETFSALLALCAGNSPVPVNSPHKGQWCGDLCLNKRLSKQLWGWWFETPSWSLWRQCNENTITVVNTSMYIKSFKFFVIMCHWAFFIAHTVAITSMWLLKISSLTHWPLGEPNVILKM